MKISPNATHFAKKLTRGVLGVSAAAKNQKSPFFSVKINEIALPIIMLPNYAANAFFHAMEMQDPVRISCADVPVVEKKMDKVRWGLE